MFTRCLLPVCFFCFFNLGLVSFVHQISITCNKGGEQTGWPMLRCEEDSHKKSFQGGLHEGERSIVIFFWGGRGWFCVQISAHQWGVPVDTYAIGPQGSESAVQFAARQHRRLSHGVDGTCAAHDM